MSDETSIPKIVHVTLFYPTGVIYGTVSCPETEARAQAWGELGWLIGKFDGSTHWVDLTWPEMPTLMPRLPIEPEVSTDGLVVTLSNLPKPCAVTVDGTRYETPDGEIEIEFALPGKYRITLAHPHYLTETLEVEL